MKKILITVVLLSMLFFGAACGSSKSKDKEETPDTDSDTEESDEDEDLDLLEFTMDEALEMIENGKIVDAKTIILIYKCLKYFKKQKNILVYKYISVVK